MEFQIVSLNGRDVDDQYTIFIYGRGADSKSVCCTTAWDPYYYVQIPHGWRSSDIVMFRSAFQDALPRDIRDHLVKITPVMKKQFYGFSNGMQFPFLRLQFSTREAWQRSQGIF